MAETATHAFCLDLLAGKNKFLLGEMPLQQQPSTFPLTRRLPADVLDAHLFAQDLPSCDLPWWDHRRGNTSRSRDLLLPADRGRGLRAIPPSHSGREERKSLFTKRNTQVRALESFPGASVVLSTGDFWHCLTFCCPCAAAPHTSWCASGICLRKGSAC